MLTRCFLRRFRRYPRRFLSGSVNEEAFGSAIEHRSFLEGMGALPAGFRVGNATFRFFPRELPTKETSMTMTLLEVDETDSFAGFFTQNAFPGHPVKVGRERLREDRIRAVVVNNKISNVGAPGGMEASERVCDAVAAALGDLGGGNRVIPCSTGVIGWGLPVDEMVGAVGSLVENLQSESAFPFARGIMTTDLFPKLRSAEVDCSSGEVGRIVGVAKGAGMVEPNLATMLSFIMTDIDVPRAMLESVSRGVVERTFNSLSIDADQSTSDTVLFLSSRKVKFGGTEAELEQMLESRLEEVCGKLAEDIVRNGEGVQHVIRVQVRNAPSYSLAKRTGKRIVNSPLFKTAVAGNDPNVGRLIMAVGNAVGDEGVDSSLLQQTTITMGGRVLFEKGEFRLGPETEAHVHRHLVDAWLWQSVPEIAKAPESVQVTTPDGAVHNKLLARAEEVSYKTPVDFPPHNRCVDIMVDFGDASPTAHQADIIGGDLTHEYVTINADYRS